MKKISLFIICFIGCLNVYAYEVPECTNTELNRLNELANNVNFKTSYTIDDETVNDIDHTVEVIYSLELVNLDKDLKIKYKANNGSIKDLNANTTKINNLGDGNITIYIYSYTTNLCTDRLLKTKTIKLPSYNEYYYFNKDKCEAHPEFKYCSEFRKTDEYYDFEKIDKEYLEYTKKDEKKEVVEEKKIPTYFYYIAGGVVGIIILITIISLVAKRRKKDDL